MLGSNNSSLSAWSNDFNYKTFLSREIDAIAKRKDVLIFLQLAEEIKTNQSYNLVNAAKIAKKKNMKVISLTGKKGGDIIKYSDTCIHIKNQKTSFIQETSINNFTHNLRNVGEKIVLRNIIVIGELELIIMVVLN